MKKRYIIRIFFGILLIIIVTIYFWINSKNKKISKNNVKNEEENNSTYISRNLNEINEIQKQINSTADSNIYQVEKEDNERKIIQVRPEEQFNVAIAGVIKNAIPNENEIEKLLEKIPEENGIWVSESSREQFEEILQNNNITEFKIDSDGYLKNIKLPQSNEAQKIEKIIESDNLYIINIKGKTYQRDYLTGTIEEYPFEDMDETQILEPYQKDNKVLLAITSNKNKKISDEEIFRAILEFM